MFFEQEDVMPGCDFPQSFAVTNDTPVDSEYEFEADRRCLIDNIAFLVVRQHRRVQLDGDERESKSADKTCHKG